MQIKNLKLHSFRCFESLEIAFQPEVTLLFADNGFGKTAIIHALAMSFSTLPQAYRGMELSLSDLRHITVERGGVYDREPAADASITLQFVMEGDDYSITNKISRGKAGERSGSDLTELLNRREEKGRSLPIFAIYHSSRGWRDGHSEDPAVRGRFSGFVRATDAGTELDAIRAWWRHQTELRNDDKPVRALDQCERAVQQFLNSGQPPAWDPVLKDIAVHIPRLRARPTLGELSDGYRNMVGLVSDLARRAAQLNPDAPDDLLSVIQGIVAIDEIDLHLHPGWQREVLPGLRRAFPCVQWVVTTHSPQVLASVTSNDDVIRLDRPDEAVHVRARDSNGILLEMGTDLRPEAGNKMLQNLQAAIDSGDFQGARTFLDKLESEFWGSDAREVVNARTQLAIRSR